MKEVVKKQVYIRPEISVICTPAFTLLEGSNTNEIKFEDLNEVEEKWIDDSEDFA